MTIKVKTKQELENFISHHLNEVNQWIDQYQRELPQPITSSVDIRESLTKYAPVDHNMYPAGFNNLCSKDLAFCRNHFSKGFFKIRPGIKKIGLLPESHTKNKFYLDHLFKLKESIEMAGIEVEIFSIDPNLFTKEDANFIELTSHSNYKIKIQKAVLNGGFFVNPETDIPFDFEAILLNNDQSTPLNLDWSKINTPVVPTPLAGWYKRQKIRHFKHYQDTAHRFCEHFHINPDLIQAKFTSVNQIDFSTKEGLDTVAQEVDKLLKELPEKAVVFVKASQGTYGMGISVVRSGNEVISMNRKIRNKMDIGKGNLKFTSVLLQEGIETMIKYDDAPAEVTIYLVDGQSSGGFIRTNPLRTSQANLNAQGMVYRKLCLADVKQDCDHTIKEAVYSVIARLSVLAASYEMKELMESE